MLYQCLILTTTVGGLGGFLASVRVKGVTGQHEQQSSVSAELEVRGGGGGSCLSVGGGTNPASSDPSPANTVPVHNVNAKSKDFFMLSPR